MDRSEYQNFASKFQKKIETIHGIIIYPAIEGIPQDVLLLPYVAKPDETLEIAIVNALAISSHSCIFTYFQNIRWIMPDLEDQLKDWQHVNAKFKGQHYFVTINIRMSYGAITFDQSVIELEPNEQDIHRNICIEVLQKEYELEVIEFPLALGVPKTFQKVVLKN